MNKLRLRQMNALILVVLASQCLAAQASDDSHVMSRVVADWRDLRQRIRGIEYVGEGQITRLKGSLTDFISPVGRKVLSGNVFPATDHTSPYRVRWLLDFVGNRVRMETTREVYHEQGETESDYQIEFRKHTSIQLFDGKVYQRFEPVSSLVGVDGNSRADLTYSGPKAKYTFFDRNDSPLLAGHRILGSAQKIATPENLRPNLDISYFHFYANATYDGRPHVVLRSEPSEGGLFLEYWLDPEQDHVIRQGMGFIGDKLITRYVMDYQKVAGVPVLASWRLTAHNADEELLQVLHVTMTTAELNPAFEDHEFHVKPKPGMYVFNNATREGWIEPVPGEPKMSVRESFRLARESNQKYGWAIALVVVVVLLFGTAVALRKLRPTKKE